MSAPETTPRRRRVLSRRRVVALATCLAALAALAVVVAVGGEEPRSGGPEAASREPGQSVRDTEEAQAHPEPSSAEAHPLAASPDEAATAEEGVSPGAPSDEEVRRDLRELERYYGRRPGAKGGGVTVSGGYAQTPPGAPQAVEQAVAGGNAIARFPYRWGGGHGSFIDDAYDCSGSVSYALAAAGLLDAPLASGDLAGLGRARARPVDHRVRERRPRVHGGRRAALRHQRARRAARITVADRAPLSPRVRGPSLARPLDRPARA